jgi:hypothetical protein
MSQALEAAQHWLTDVEADLDPEWSRAAGSSNTLLVITLEEAEALENAVQDLLAPYVQRGPDGAPPNGRAVRMIRMSLPEATI